MASQLNVEELERLRSDQSTNAFVAGVLAAVGETDADYSIVVQKLVVHGGRRQTLSLLADVWELKRSRPLIPNTVGGLLLKLAKRTLNDDVRRIVFSRRPRGGRRPLTVDSFAAAVSRPTHHVSVTDLASICVKT